MLLVENLHKKFGGVVALDGVSLSLGAGELVGVIGPNGSGKTTLINVISGYVKPDRGRVFFDGRDITSLKPHQRARLGIVRSFQFPLISNNLTVRENVKIAVAALHGYSLRPIDGRAVEDILDLFGLREVADVKVGKISEGHRKLLDVAMAMVHKPRVVLLDEPTSSVSSREKFAVMDRVVEILRERRVAALVVEHDLEVVKSYMDRVVEMNNGRVAAVYRPGEVA
ncbi:ABC transporter ATP-binding protein [Pyrobaculum sp. 3827-6]|uniref:ABC transporter ATP-binding protein n=1 Tax=Pyrobaculum sp. 3827-6 TaxID=2983604 RepID=UPI0021DA63BD|nr:ABC transporter ATP-binding protein [Pyrobaculum sp. 3827-6]MCU7787631.1 ABC transporter ATP-binding protein [Pyrobaculum sp. 3827-6]